MDCPYCGNPLTRYDKTCPECGLQVPQLQSHDPEQAPAEPVEAPLCNRPTEPGAGLTPDCAAAAFQEETAEAPVSPEPVAEPAAAAEPAAPADAPSVPSAETPMPAARPVTTPAAGIPAPLPEETDGPNQWLLLALGVFMWPVALILFLVLMNKRQWAGFELLTYAICGSVGMVLCFIGLWLPGLLAPAAGVVVWNFIASRKA